MENPTTNITIPTTTNPTICTTNPAGGNGIKRIRSTQKVCGEVPQWVKAMINIHYTDSCKIHSDAKDNRLGRFCINCVRSFCNQCCSDHEGHTHMKIRRYVYNDVIKRPDFQKHFDCSGIQGYMTNKNKVLFLKPKKENQEAKEQHQKARCSCIICNRTLIDACYCSIQCKISAMKTVNTEDAEANNNLIKVIVEEPDSGLQNNVNTEETTLDNNVKLVVDKIVNTEEYTILHHKKTPRKGIPQRSPLF